MIATKNNTRYKNLLLQLQVDSSVPLYTEVSQSLRRLLSYLYHHTVISYIEDIDEKVLYDYISFQSLQMKKENGFVQAIRDVKMFILFLKNIKKVKKIPQIDLSVRRFAFTRLIRKERESRDVTCHYSYGHYMSGK